jgi:uncharacterized protein
MSSSNSKNERRRKFAARWQEITASATPLRTFAENVSQVARDALNEASQLTVERLAINLPRLPPKFDGWRVVQLSDIHHSPFTDAAQIEESVRIANELKPDIVVLTGDYVSHETEYIAPVAEMLGKLNAPHGVYAVLGNHDHWTDAEMVTDLLRAENIKVLINEGFRFELDGDAIWLCGVDDTMVGLTDLDLALAGARYDEFKFLLCHNPSILRQAERRGVDFIVSGHTHGGQVRLRQKAEGLIMPRNRRASGLSSKGNTQVYVSRGIGTVVLPVRYQCPPEISSLELRCSNF